MTTIKRTAFMGDPGPNAAAELEAVKAATGDAAAINELRTMATTLQGEVTTAQTAVTTLQQVAAEMEPVKRRSEIEHERLQGEIDTTRQLAQSALQADSATSGRVGQLEASQDRQDEDIAAARQAATEAQQGADTARQAAQSAGEAAGLATSNAATARTVADAARTTADGAQQTAAQAAADSATAKATAQNATATAAQAQTAATAAGQTAATAKTAADSAATAAASAGAKADQAQTAAAAAKTTADKAASDLASLQGRVSALEARQMYQEFGQAAVSGILALNATRDVPVALTGTMPNSTYQVRLVSMADSLVGKLTVVGVKNVTPSGFTATVRAGLAVTLAGSVTFSATCLA